MPTFPTWFALAAVLLCLLRWAQWRFHLGLAGVVLPFRWLWLENERR
jgi:hypothetical protein